MPPEGFHSFWQAFVFTKNNGNIENGRKRNDKFDKKCCDVKIYLFLELKTHLFPLK